MAEYKTIAQTQNFIILDKYTENILGEQDKGYQSEADLEHSLIQDLQAQGYEYLPTIKSPAALLENARIQIENLNKIKFTNNEWQRFVVEYLDTPSDDVVCKTNKIQNNYIYDFIFDDGHIHNIYLVDKQNITNNKLQVINQFEQTGISLNRYDVTILVNGLPMVQIELKKRGQSIREAFNQVHRYSKESFNSESSLYKYLQIFVISNGTDTRYFANTIQRNKNHFDFTINWAKADNTLIKDLKDFTATFFQKHTLLQVLFIYSVFDVDSNLLIMRPYQIAATERVIWKIKSSYAAKLWSKPEGGGYVWHTTGSGKTLTSFKVARLATELDFIDKVFFVVDRKDLDYQTIREYQRFSPNSVNGSKDTKGLKTNIESQENKIIVTTIQKLNNLVKLEKALEVYNKQVVFIFDECHRSQFGEAQKNITKKFKKYYQFGFTGTPIFQENALGSETTASVFGRQLHSYVITDAIRDDKVLKFKVDYNNVRPQFSELEQEQNDAKLSVIETKNLLLHPSRIQEVSQYIIKNFNIKTHRNVGTGGGFNAMFAVSNVNAAKLYYETLNALQAGKEHKLKIATIYSFAQNEEQYAKGDIADETFEPTAMDSSAKEFLLNAIEDYNYMFRTSFTIDSVGFQNYYRDLAYRVKNKQIDLLIVVGMFLTGFDAPCVNTLFVDKNLRYHGLLQAFSRTNRILSSQKTFGNIVTFRDLEQATKDALSLFGDKNTTNMVLEKSYAEYLNGFKDIISGDAKRGYIVVINDLKTKFPNPQKIETNKDKKEFVKVFGEYIKLETILQNFDEYTFLKEFQKIDRTNTEQVEQFKVSNFLTDKDIALMKNIPVLSERALQDYKSTYNDIREWIKREKEGEDNVKFHIDWADVVFEIEHLKDQDITLDYILEVVLEHSKNKLTKDNLIDEIRHTIRASIDNRAKEGLLIEYINNTDVNQFADKTQIIDSFYTYAQGRQKEEAESIILEEGLNREEALHYIHLSLRREYACETGTELNSILPLISPLNPQYRTKKQSVFRKISAFIEKFKGIGGNIL